MPSLAIPRFWAESEYLISWATATVIGLLPMHTSGNSSADLVAHFFIKAYDLIKERGAFGFIATNTIAQGDTRHVGLRHLLARGASIYRTIRRLAWPGEAGVVVSILHIKHGISRHAELDGRKVESISAYLVEGHYDDQPAILRSNLNLAFQGSIPLGMGFTFDNAASEKGIAENLEKMRALIKSNPSNQERIFPYLGGEEVANDPRHAHHRFHNRLRRNSAVNS